MRCLSSQIWIFSNVLVNLVLSLRVTINSSELPFHEYIQDTFHSIFISLRETRQYDSIYKLLSLNTFDTINGYNTSCYSMKSEDYRGIIEYFYATNNMNALKVVLSADCLMALDNNIFMDINNSSAIRDLPTSILSCDKRIFNYRTDIIRNSFCSIISHAQISTFHDTNWDNIVMSFPFIRKPEDAISLRSIISSCANGRINYDHLFYYLNPSMITTSNVCDDILWLMEQITPNINSFKSSVNKEISKKCLANFNLQVFKTVTALAFYFHIQKLGKYFLSIKLRPVFDAAKESLLRKFEIVRTITSDLLSRKSPSESSSSINNLANMINSLLNLFLPDTNSQSLSSIDINNLFKSIFVSFSKYSPKIIQGDWLYNLFFIFFTSGTTQPRLTKNLSQEFLLEGFEIFFNKKPTNISIKKVHELIMRGNIKHKQNIYKLFESKIPADRLKEIYEKRIIFIEDLSYRFQEIPFSSRFAHLLKCSRKKLGEIVSIYLEKQDPCPSVNNLDTSLNNSRLNLARQLLNVFESTVLAIYRYDSNLLPIYSYGKYEVIENNFIKKVDIRYFLKQFLNLILVIPEFHIVKYNTEKPTVYITTLISKNVSFVFGQVLAVSIILNVPIPFIIHPSQLGLILNNDQEEAFEYKHDMIQFCKKSNLYLNLLQKDKKSSVHSNFSLSLRSYLASFFTWKSLFLIGDIENVDALIIDSINSCNAQISEGFNFYFNNSKFTFEEIKILLSK